MRKHIKNKPVKESEETKTDLKHDNMEFSASTEDEGSLDIDDPNYEEEEITSEELDDLENDTPDDNAYALNDAETDSEADEDNLPEEDWLNDIPDK